MLCRVSGMIFLLIYSAIAVLTGTFKLFIAVCIPYMSVRIFSGGIHMKTYWSCFWFTFASIAFIDGYGYFAEKFMCGMYC